MEPTAQYALTGSVVASALGGITLSLLIVGYGFTSAEDETPDAARRRLFLIRIGHAAAAVCFAVTALLSVVALASRSAVGDRSLSHDPSTPCSSAWIARTPEPPPARPPADPPADVLAPDLL